MDVSEPQKKTPVPKSLWVIGVFAVLWNLLGMMAFFSQVFAREAGIEAMPESQREWARSVPGWIDIVFGVAVLTAVIGSVGLFARQGWALPVFLISFVAILIQMGYTIVVAGGYQVLGPVDLVMPILVTTIGAALAWYAYSCKGRGLLN